MYSPLVSMCSVGVEELDSPMLLVVVCRALPWGSGENSSPQWRCYDYYLLLFRRLSRSPIATMTTTTPRSRRNVDDVSIATEVNVVAFFPSIVTFTFADGDDDDVDDDRHSCSINYDIAAATCWSSAVRAKPSVARKGCASRLAP